TTQGQLGVARCGFERWPVKVLADPDARSVKYTPHDETITRLLRLSRPRSYPQLKRIAPVELTVFRVSAVANGIHLETDSDIHLVLSDPAAPDNTIIAEVPAPECAIGSGHESDFEAARKVALRLSPGTQVIVVGVGFFDKTHGQAGSARNGIEI